VIHQRMFLASASASRPARVWSGRRLAALVLCLAGGPLTAAAQGLDPIAKVSVYPGRDFTQGEWMQINLSIVPPADAPGAVTVLVDGLGTRDGFVRRMFATPFDCPYGGCSPPFVPVPCAAGRACFGLVQQLGVRMPIGRHAFPITIVDARGRQTRTSAAVDIRPAVDGDADGMPDAWEAQFGLLYDPNMGGAGDDPDRDGVGNLEEFRRGTNPRARYTRYFAEWSSGDRAPGLEQCFVSAALKRDEAGAMWYTLIGDGGRRLEGQHSVNNNSSIICPLDRAQHPADRVVAVVVESEQPMVVERIAVTRDPFEIPFGSIGAATPSSRWMFADGGADGELDTFYLAFNPGPDPVEATFTYRTPAGAIARRRTSVLPPGVRTTTWVNVDDAPLGRTEAWLDIAATSPILVERAWRFDPPGRTVTQQSAAPGTDDASTRWFFPEVDGAAPFDTTIVLANPADREAVLDVNLLFTDAEARRAGQVRVPAGGRITLPARAILPGTRASVEIVSANGVRVAGERTLRGRDERGPWRVAEVGLRAPGPLWTLPSTVGAGELVVTNVSPFPARVELHFYASYSYGSDLVKVVDVPARRRVVLPAGGLDTLRVTSQPTEGGTADIVVEAERYTAVGGVARARASGVVGLRVP
jgi:hypothetical protein